MHPESSLQAAAEALAEAQRRITVVMEQIVKRRIETAAQADDARALVNDAKDELFRASRCLVDVVVGAAR